MQLSQRSIGNENHYAISNPSQLEGDLIIAGAYEFPSYGTIARLKRLKTNGEIICDIKNGFLYYKLSNGEEKKIKMLNSKDIIFKSQLEVFFNKKEKLFNDFCNVKDGLAVLKIIEESLTMNKFHSKI